MQYQSSILSALGSGNQELVKIAQSMAGQSKEDLIHFVNEATNNTPVGADTFTSAFKDPFNMVLQNFELMRAAMADSFGAFEKNVQNVTNLSKGQDQGPAKKKAAKEG